MECSLGRLEWVLCLQAGVAAFPLGACRFKMEVAIHWHLRTTQLLFAQNAPHFVLFATVCLNRGHVQTLENKHAKDKKWHRKANQNTHTNG